MVSFLMSKLAFKIHLEKKPLGQIPKAQSSDMHFASFSRCAGKTYDEPDMILMNCNNNHEGLC